MEQYKDHLKDISAIRDLMDKHSKFISLSGLSGVSAGLTALAGASVVYFAPAAVTRNEDTYLAFLLLTALGVLVVALGLALFFSMRLATRKGLPTWNGTAQRMLIHLAVPLVAGAAFCLIQYKEGSFLWIPATTLMFYGMALMSAAKYTIIEIRYLGVSEIVLGLVCAAWFEHSLLFWALGFGILHILYGIVIYYKYER